MLNITPEYFEQPNGGLIVCMSEEEYHKCLEELHNMGFIWASGDNLWPVNDYTPNYGAPAKRKPSFLEAVYDALQERDDEIDDTHMVMIGRTMDNITDPANMVRFARVSAHEDRKSMPATLWRAKRTKFQNIVWPERGTYKAAEEINYDDEN